MPTLLFVLSPGGLRRRKFSAVDFPVDGGEAYIARRGGHQRRGGAEGNHGAVG